MIPASEKSIDRELRRPDGGGGEALAALGVELEPLHEGIDHSEDGLCSCWGHGVLTLPSAGVPQIEWKPMFEELKIC